MSEPKKRPGRWKPGESGNPAGRKPGTGRITALRESIAEHLPEVVAVVLEQARAGDVAACRLLLERVLPAVKPVEVAVPIELPDEGLSEQGRAVLAAVGAGEIAPGQGAALIGAVAALARVVEVDELEKRISALETLREVRA